MVSRDSYLKEVFPKPPLTGFKRQRNLRDYLIRAKIPEETRKYPKRHQKGMKKCNKPWCSRVCPLIKEGKYIKTNNQTWNINKTVDCNTSNVVYMIECTKENCQNSKYIGETSRSFRSRLAEHRGYITNRVIDQATGAHFNLPGHSLADMKATIIEHVKKQSDIYRKERENFFIRKFNTFHAGLNKRQ